MQSASSYDGNPDFPVCKMYVSGRAERPYDVAEAKAEQSSCSQGRKNERESTTVLPPVIGSLQLFAKAVSENPEIHLSLAVAGIRDLQIPGKRSGNSVQFPIGTTLKDFYVGTADLAGVLGVTANELSQLHRSSILERIADPRNKKAVLYPVFDSIVVTANTDARSG